MAQICESCRKQYSYDYFNTIISDVTDIAFRQIITYGCLCQLLAWAKAKKQSCKSTVGNTDDVPTDLTGIVHTVINKIHTFGASSSNAPSVQLKSTVPAYCTLNRSVTRALTTGNANCCLVAQCLYESSSATLHTQTATERKRASRQDSNYRQQEQTARRYASAGLCDSDVSVCPSVRPSVCHTPVLCLAERKQDREMYTI